MSLHFVCATGSSLGPGGICLLSNHWLCTTALQAYNECQGHSCGRIQKPWAQGTHSPEGRDSARSHDSLWHHDMINSLMKVWAMHWESRKWEWLIQPAMAWLKGDEFLPHLSFTCLLTQENCDTSEVYQPIYVTIYENFFFLLERRSIDCGYRLWSYFLKNEELLSWMKSNPQLPISPNQ